MWHGPSLPVSWPAAPQQGRQESHDLRSDTGMALYCCTVTPWHHASNAVATLLKHCYSLNVLLLLRGKKQRGWLLDCCGRTAVMLVLPLMSHPGSTETGRETGEPVRMMLSRALQNLQHFLGGWLQQAGICNSLACLSGTEVFFAEFPVLRASSQILPQCAAFQAALCYGRWLPGKDKADCLMDTPKVPCLG